MSETEEYSLGYNHSDSSEELLWRSMIFNTVYILLEQRTSRITGVHFSSFKQKKKERKVSMYTVISKALVPEKEALS